MYFRGGGQDTNGVDIFCSLKVTKTDSQVLVGDSFVKDAKSDRKVVHEKTDGGRTISLQLTNRCCWALMVHLGAMTRSIYKLKRN